MRRQVTHFFSALGVKSSRPPRALEGDEAQGEPAKMLGGSGSLTEWMRTGDVGAEVESAT
jgi:hypothetical protein